MKKSFYIELVIWQLMEEVINKKFHKSNRSNGKEKVWIKVEQKSDTIIKMEYVREEGKQKRRSLIPNYVYQSCVFIKCVCKNEGYRFLNRLEYPDKINSLTAIFITSSKKTKAEVSNKIDPAKVGSSLKGLQRCIFGRNGLSHEAKDLVFRLLFFFLEEVADLWILSTFYRDLRVRMLTIKESFISKIRYLMDNEQVATNNTEVRIFYSGL